MTARVAGIGRRQRGRRREPLGRYQWLARAVTGKGVAPVVAAEHAGQKFGAQSTSVATCPVDVQPRGRPSSGCLQSCSSRVRWRGVGSRETETSAASQRPWRWCSMSVGEGVERAADQAGGSIRVPTRSAAVDRDRPCGAPPQAGVVDSGCRRVRRAVEPVGGGRCGTARIGGRSARRGRRRCPRCARVRTR